MSNKMPISWHKQNLKNQFLTIERAKEERDRIEKYLHRLQGDFLFYEFQIKEAEAEGRDSFDRDKFRLNKLKEK